MSKPGVSTLRDKVSHQISNAAPFCLQHPEARHFFSFIALWYSMGRRLLVKARSPFGARHLCTTLATTSSAFDRKTLSWSCTICFDASLGPGCRTRLWSLRRSLLHESADCHLLVAAVPLWDIWLLVDVKSLLQYINTRGDDANLHGCQRPVHFCADC